MQSFAFGMIGVAAPATDAYMAPSAAHATAAIGAECSSCGCVDVKQRKVATSYRWSEWCAVPTNRWPPAGWKRTACTAWVSVHCRLARGGPGKL